MNKRTIDEMITYFNQEVSNMDIARKYKMALLGMITAIGYESKKQEVVRCKDCKYWHREIHDGIEYFNFSSCDLNHYGDGHDFYCADGKRKEQSDG